MICGLKENIKKKFRDWPEDAFTKLMSEVTLK